MKADMLCLALPSVRKCCVVRMRGQEQGFAKAKSCLHLDQLSVSSAAIVEQLLLVQNECKGKALLQT